MKKEVNVVEEVKNNMVVAGKLKDEKGKEYTLEVSKFITQQWEYEEVMGKNPSNFKGSTFPVETVSLIDALEYCNKLSIMSGYKPVYTIISNPKEGQEPFTIDEDADGYRIPTSDEWVFAATAGGKENFQYSGSDDINEVAWYEENSNNTTHPVGQLKPNGLGLYDMSGNVWEWTTTKKQ